MVGDRIGRRLIAASHFVCHLEARGVNLHVALPFDPEYDHPVSSWSDVGEDWNLYSTGDNSP